MAPQRVPLHLGVVILSVVGSTSASAFDVSHVNSTQTLDGSNEVQPLKTWRSIKRINSMSDFSSGDAADVRNEDFGSKQTSAKHFSEHFYFYNNVPTLCGPDSEFGLEQIPQVVPLHRIGSKYYKAKMIEEWITEARLVASWKTLKDGHELFSHEEQGPYLYTEPSKEGDTSRFSFETRNWKVFRISSMLGFRSSLPDFRRLLCSSEWEGEYSARVLGASTSRGEENLKFVLPWKSEGLANSWWGGKRTFYSMAKDCVCQKLIFGRSHILKDGNEFETYQVKIQGKKVTLAARGKSFYSRLLSFAWRNVPSNEPEVDSGAKHIESSLDEKIWHPTENPTPPPIGRVFTLFQTSVFHDALRIKIDMESQFFLAIAFVWVLHYLYLLIVVYVLRDDEDFSRSERRPFLRQQHRGYHSEAFAIAQDHPTPPRPLTSYGIHKGKKASCATASTHVEYDLSENFGLSPYESNRKFQDNTTALVNFDLGEQDTILDDSEREARGVPEFIHIQPSYLTTLCLLDSDTDDFSDSEWS